MRDKELIFEVIQQTMEAITEQEAIIRAQKEQIPQIELDIIMDNIRKLYENFLLLNNLNKTEKERIEKTFFHKSSSFQETKNNEPGNVNLEGDLPINMIDIGFIGKDDEVNTEEHIEQEVPTEQAVDNILQADTSEKMDTPVINDNEIAFDLFAEPVTIADKLKSTQKTVIDNFSQGKEGKSVADHMQKTPITDLKSFVGINDRFIFVNELFGGNMKAYDECINKLNTFTELNEAMTYMRWMRDHHGMNEKLESYKRLLEFIHRKYKK